MAHSQTRQNDITNNYWTINQTIIVNVSLNYCLLFSLEIPNSI